MVPVVPDAKLAFHDLCDAGRSPQVCAVSQGHRSLDQQPGQIPLLARIEQGRATVRCSDLVHAVLFFLASVAPSHDGTGSALQSTRHLVEGKTVVEQIQSLSAAFCDQIGGTLGSHAGLLFGDQSIALFMQMSIIISKLEPNAFQHQVCIVVMTLVRFPVLGYTS